MNILRRQWLDDSSKSMVVQYTFLSPEGILTHWRRADLHSLLDSDYAMLWYADCDREAEELFAEKYDYHQWGDPPTLPKE